ncbi:MAG: HD domain-containing protein [Candidatus Shapirobacteria bacterium]
MNNESIVLSIANLVKEKFINENSGHDWDHAKHVWENAIKIGNGEKGVNIFVVELAALLHDVNDWKKPDEEIVEGNKNILEWLNKFNIEKEIIDQIFEVINNVSFHGPNSITKEVTKETEIVRDADRLEAMGAVGWERCLKFGRSKGSPDINEYLPNLNLTDEEYKDHSRKANTSINHVFEKLLLLKRLLSTDTGKEMGKVRHEELKTAVKEYLVGILGKKIVSDDRIRQYIKMLDVPSFN